MNFGVDLNMGQLIMIGFCLSFGIWALSRVIRLIFELAGSKNGVVKPE